MKEDWLSMWIDDRESIISTMINNMVDDLYAGYNPNGKSITMQKHNIEETQREYSEQLMRLAVMKEGEVARWCYFDLLRRGAITR